MVQRVVVLFIAALFIAGCAAAPKSYETGAIVTPADQPHIYTVDFSISRIEGDTIVLLSAPRLSVRAGEEGKIVVRDQSGRNSFTCSAHVFETNDGYEAVTKVAVTSDGREELRNTQTVCVKR
jgi:hypothetical protein